MNTTNPDISLSSAAPCEEPQRQYYYIEKARTYIQKKSKEIGRPLTFCVTTFGCQMNARDSEKLRGILERIGYEEAPEDVADFVIYNTCTVRENANTRVYGRLGQLKPLKKKNPHMMIGLCGCMMQEPEVVEKLKKSYRFVDIIFGTHNIFKFADTGIRETLRKMEVFGGVRSRYQCTIAGGAKMFEMSAGIGNIGERNVQMVLKVLAEEHIRVKAKDVGANYARTMLLDVETGGVKVRTSNRQEIILLR